VIVHVQRELHRREERLEEAGKMRREHTERNLGSISRSVAAGSALSIFRTPLANNSTAGVRCRQRAGVARAAVRGASRGHARRAAGSGAVPASARVLGAELMHAEPDLARGGGGGGARPGGAAAVAAGETRHHRSRGRDWRR